MGYQRTLQATDLWKMDASRETGPMSAKLDASWDRRKKAATAWNEKLLRGELKPIFLKRLLWSLRALSGGRHYSERYASFETRWREVDGQRQPSLAWALNDTFGYFFWGAGLFKVGSFDIRYEGMFGLILNRYLEIQRNLWVHFLSRHVNE